MLRTGLLILCMVAIPIIGHAADNQIMNNSFEDDSDVLDDGVWITGTGSGGAEGVFSIDNSESIDGSESVKVEIIATHADSWRVGLIQTGLSLKKDVEHTYTFWAKAETPRTIDMEVKRTQAGGLPYQGITGGNFNITTEWTEFVHNFTPTIDYPEQNVPRNDGETQAWAELDFWLAGEDPTIWIDFVQLYEGPYEEILPDSLAGPTAVEATGKLAVTWGTLKQR